LKHSLKSRCLAAAAVLLLGTGALHATAIIPEGTVLAARLNTTLSTKKTKTGQVVKARIMQDVPLPDGRKIPAGALLVGHVTGINAASTGTEASISLRFESLRIPHEQILLSLRLRAIANYTEVDRAQVPIDGADPGIPESAWTTRQIGGEIVYRGGGPVENRQGVVGRPVPGGVLSSLNSNPDGGCNGGDAGGGPQALWLFSSYACGTYSLPDLIIAHAGRSDPAGEITFRSSKGEVIIPGGSGLLFRVNDGATPHV
jgi:hypothetical protein